MEETKDKLDERMMQKEAQAAHRLGVMRRTLDSLPRSVRRKLRPKNEGFGDMMKRLAASERK